MSEEAKKAWAALEAARKRLTATPAAEGEYAEARDRLVALGEMRQLRRKYR